MTEPYDGLMQQFHELRNFMDISMIMVLMIIVIFAIFVILGQTTRHQRIQRHIDDVKFETKNINRILNGRHSLKEVVRGLKDTGKYDPSIINQKLKIKNDDTTEPILCPNCGVSVMAQWQKCYHCGELL